MEKVDNICEEMGNFKRELETFKKPNEKMLVLKTQIQK